MERTRRSFDEDIPVPETYGSSPLVADLTMNFLSPPRFLDTIVHWEEIISFTTTSPDLEIEAANSNFKDDGSPLPLAASWSPFNECFKDVSSDDFNEFWNSNFLEDDKENTETNTSKLFGVDPPTADGSTSKSN